MLVIMKYTLFLLLLLSSAANAVICKTIGKDGVVAYADVPADECANKVKLPASSGYSPRTIKENAFTQRNKDKTKDKQKTPTYTSVQIISPEQDGTVRNNTGEIVVSVKVTPNLAKGDLLRLFINGQQSDQDFSTTSVKLSNLDRGTHQLKASIISLQGKLVLTSEVVSFTLHRHIIKKALSTGKTSKKTSPPSFVTPGFVNPIFYPNY